MRTLLASLPLLLGVAAGASAQTPDGLLIDSSTCQYLTRHRPAADVEYTPGVDVHGRAVAPADLPGTGGPSIDRFDIPVTMGLARRLGYAVPPGLPRDMEVGRLTLLGDRLYFNGQPIGATRETEIYALCRGR